MAGKVPLSPPISPIPDRNKEELTVRLIRKNAHKSRWATLIALVLLTACSGGSDTDSSTEAEETGAARPKRRRPRQPATEAAALGTIVVGSTNFDEQELIAEMYAQSLEQAGFTVERRYQLGNREIVLPALTAGEIDVYPEYAATALEFLNEGAGEATR